MLPILLAILVQLIGGATSAGLSAQSGAPGTVQTAITGEVAG
jgi:hypothetical protein